MAAEAEYDHRLIARSHGRDLMDVSTNRSDDTHDRPLVIAYATQCVAPIVVPGRKVESTLTRAIAVDLTASAGA